MQSCDNDETQTGNDGGDEGIDQSAKLADVVLPACSWAEKSGTVTSLERRLQQISRAEEPLGESKPDWDIIQTLAKKMGSSMHYGTPADILNEIRSTVPLYTGLAVGGIWPRERSPLAGADVDLSLRDRVLEQCCQYTKRLSLSNPVVVLVPRLFTEEYNRFFPLLASIANEIVSAQEETVQKDVQGLLF